MRSQGTRESLDFFSRSLETPRYQVNASRSVFYLMFVNDCRRARFYKDVEKCESNDLGRDAPSRAKASFADAREALCMEARVRLRPY